MVRRPPPLVILYVLSVQRLDLNRGLVLFRGRGQLSHSLIIDPPWRINALISCFEQESSVKLKESQFCTTVILRAKKVLRELEWCSIMYRVYMGSKHRDLV